MSRLFNIIFDISLIVNVTVVNVKCHFSLSMMLILTSVVVIVKCHILALSLSCRPPFSRKKKLENFSWNFFFQENRRLARRLLFKFWMWLFELSHSELIRFNRWSWLCWTSISYCRSSLLMVPYQEAWEFFEVSIFDKNSHATTVLRSAAWLCGEFRSEIVEKALVCQTLLKHQESFAFMTLRIKWRHYFYWI